MTRKASVFSPSQAWTSPRRSRSWVWGLLRELSICPAVYPQPCAHTETPDFQRKPGVGMRGAKGIRTPDLIHWPNPRIGLFGESWHAMCEAQQQGLIRRIGVSNFDSWLINQLPKDLPGPAVVQAEIHPWWPQEEFIQWLKERRIQPTAWSRQILGGLQPPLKSDW